MNNFGTVLNITIITSVILVIFSLWEGSAENLNAGMWIESAENLKELSHRMNSTLKYLLQIQEKK